MFCQLDLVWLYAGIGGLALAHLNANSAFADLQGHLLLTLDILPSRAQENPEDGQNLLSWLFTLTQEDVTFLRGPTGPLLASFDRLTSKVQ